MENLKKIREKKKVTQVRLSIAAEVSQETISAYESGKAFPSVETLIKIADFLGTSTDYLLGRINDDMPLLSIKKNGFDVTDLMLLDSFEKMTKDKKNKIIGYIENKHNISKEHVEKKGGYYISINNENEVFVQIGKLKQFCVENNICYQNVSRLANNKIQKYRKVKIRKTF